jgi:hypothetical protein
MYIRICRRESRERRKRREREMNVERQNVESVANLRQNKLKGWMGDTREFFATFL